MNKNKKTGTYIAKRIKTVMAPKPAANTQELHAYDIYGTYIYLFFYGEGKIVFNFIFWEPPKKQK